MEVPQHVSHCPGRVWAMTPCWSWSTVHTKPGEGEELSPAQFSLCNLFCSFLESVHWRTGSILYWEHPGNPLLGLLTYPAPRCTGAAPARQSHCVCLPTSPQMHGDTAAGRRPSWRTVLGQTAQRSQTWLLLLLAHILQEQTRTGKGKRLSDRQDTLPENMRLWKQIGHIDTRLTRATKTKQNKHHKRGGNRQLKEILKNILCHQIFRQRKIEHYIFISSFSPEIWQQSNKNMSTLEYDT